MSSTVSSSSALSPPARPTRIRVRSHSPESQEPGSTTPLRILKRETPLPTLNVVRRSSSSWRHVRENNLVSKSPFRSRLPGPSPRRVSGEKRPRTDSMVENEHPLGFKRRDSKSFAAMVNSEPVTKSTFRAGRNRENSSEDAVERAPPPVPPKMPAARANNASPSPVRPSLVTKRLHGPRGVGTLGRRVSRQRRKTVTWDESCVVVEFERDAAMPHQQDTEDGEEAEEAEVGEEAEEGEEEGDLSEFSEDYGEEEEEDGMHMQDSFDVADDSITGIVDSMLEDAAPHTPPPPEDRDVELLPPSPSPSKPRRDFTDTLDEPPPPHRLSRSPVAPPNGRSLVVAPNMRDEVAPFDESFRSVDSILSSSSTRSTSLDPANLSIGNSEVSLSGLDLDSIEGPPRSLSRTRSSTPLNMDDLPRSTPPLVSTRFSSPGSRSASASPFARQLFRPSSSSSLASTASGRKNSPRISREDLQQRLLRRRSQEAFEAAAAAAAGHTSVSTDIDEPEPEPKLRAMVRGQHATYDGVMSLDPEPQAIDPPRASLMERSVTMDTLDAKRAFEGLDLDFEHGFALGEEGMSMSAGLHINRTSVHLGDVSALDRLMDNVAQSVAEPAPHAFGGLKIESVEEGVQAAQLTIPAGFAAPAIEDIALDLGLDVDVDMDVSVDADAALAAAFRARATPPMPSGPPARDAIRAREELIKAKKREARRREEGYDDDDDDEGEDAPPLPRRQLETPSAAMPPSTPEPPMAGGSRPNRRRSRSTGEVGPAGRPQVQRNGTTGLLGVGAFGNTEAPLGASIDQELKRLENMPRRGHYHVKQHSETIYASADADRISHMDGAGDVDTGKAWRTVRRPSDMNEYSKQIKELRAQDKTGKAHGKVFVRVVGLKGLDVPIPDQPTTMACTLNNGIHFVTTPECPLTRDCRIDQEFELIEHSKLEFTLTIKVKRDPHIVAQFKANTPPAAPARPPPQPLPPASKGGGMRSFLGFGSPKKSKARHLSPAPPPPPPPAANFRMQENLARYLKPDGALARAFVSFKDIARRCDTKLFETTFPLIGQRLESPNNTKPLQVGEIVLQVFRLPPLNGVPPDQLPQSLEECHRGLRHVNWHKATYCQGTLTQSGGDCMTWRRRQFRIIGANLVAFNDVTKKAIATVDLRKAIAVEDNSSPTVRSPASGVTVRSTYDEPYGGVERSFRLVFGPGPDEEILFFADTDEEKTRWMDVLRALVGRIPPNPLWAELVYQLQHAPGAPAQDGGTGAPSSSR